MSVNVTVRDKVICDFFLQMIGKVVPPTGFCAGKASVSTVRICININISYYIHKYVAI